MPFIPHNPEALLSRSDSKDPATTCKGITDSGRNCRRSLATSPSPSPRSQKTRNGVLAVLPGSDDHEGAAAFFCWQHKDQAVNLQTPGKGGHPGATQLHTLNSRTSIDTLADRLGLIDIHDHENEPKEKRQARRAKQASHPVRKDTLPQKWQDVQGPLLSLPHPSGKPPRNRHSHKSGGFLSLLCCMSSSHDTYSPPAPHPRPHAEKPSSNPAPTAKIPRPHSTTPSPRTPLAPKDPNRPSLAHTPTSQTQTLLSFIPPHLSPQTTSLLLAELAKPVSQSDEEGYIYIFWLTPNSAAAPDTAAVSSLLQDSGGGGGVGAKKRDGERGKEKTILLKIGRANNVHRRMNEWTKQCGHALTLLRYYPHIPSSPLPSPSSKVPRSPQMQTLTPPLGAGVRKVPCVHKVERLIHLELAEKRVKRGCGACGKEHREWFEVEGTREGVRSVDEVVRRWVGWGEGRG